MYEMMMYLWIGVSQGVGEGALQPRGGFGTLTQVGFKLFTIFVVIASLQKDARQLLLLFDLDIEIYYYIEV